ncbi:hypothetical protein Rhopal_001168-T1 [Rhodotorula paludigena]|uniref:Uncharacterized protein n=1 Tax=Rhodotorula paludigena TaxID=86838 RepID=A0AAV5GD31_9BASI|nr:hypothetical protein Rhopal_001168-T1 [Rhodotorula paludigena]
MPVPAPAYSTSDLLARSPTLSRLSRKRLAPSRLADLVRAAGADRPPKEPELWECCGSSCKPREEKKVWDEVHPDGVDEEDEDEAWAALDRKDDKADADEKVAIEEGVPDAGGDEPRRAVKKVEIELEKLELGHNDEKEDERSRDKKGA